MMDTTTLIHTGIIFVAIVFLAAVLLRLRTQRGGRTPTVPSASGNKAEVAELLARGKKIEAIKLVREQTGLGLKEAKDFVETLEAGQLPAVSMPATVPPPADPMHAASALLATGNKIEAIRLVREQTGLGLKEAKDYVEALEAGQIPTVPVPPTAPQPLANMDAAARLLLAQDKKIEAIKLVREQTGVGLKEAKDYVEALERQTRT
jgi:ribosomal protein L7/L12